jgi:ribonuclease HI
MMDFFTDPKTLNIFCDASITKINGETIGCPGAIAIDNININKIKEHSYVILRETTNNNSEITAIQLAIRLGIKYKDVYDRINIFSDSQICVFGLRKWIFDWLYGMHNNVMYSSTGEPVANQQIILNIVNLILSYNFRFNLFHQKGHVYYTTSSLENAKNVFEKSNNVTVSDEFIQRISFYNDYIDKFTKDVLSNNDLLEIQKRIVPIKHIIDPKSSDVIKYKNLIKGGK